MDWIIEHESSFSEMHPVGPGMDVIPHALVRITNETGVEGVIEIELDFDASLGRFAASRVTVIRAGEGDEITGAALRELTILEYVQIASIGLVFIEVEGGGGDKIAAHSAFRQFTPVSGRATDVDVRHAAQIYYLAKVTNHPPLKEVAEVLQVSQSTATRLISRARDAGLLQDKDGLEVLSASALPVVS